MPKQKRSSLNWLEQHLPEGLIVDSAWLGRHGYSTSLRTQYLKAGWLHQPARRVYTRRDAPLSWQQVVISLQTLLEQDLAVGGRTALELQGFAHYLQQQEGAVYLYGQRPPPTWLKNLRASASFAYRNDKKLFRELRVPALPRALTIDPTSKTKRHDTLTLVSWGQWSWPLVLSSPERAVLELLDELPNRESFHQVDMLMEGLSTLSPARLQALLVDCHSVKVKRLFFFFAERHQHAWLRRLDRKAVDLGSGRRRIARDGKFDARHLITVPKDLDGVR
ncbi:type IV toxin-antitoxin system AbiEi family antitoxin domain-containing protein [Hyphomicrobium sp.]|jgi:hypothetical protein|uniref:type IV toxin-antitoxin system AbiEi family antitoxin domain-containing protein n=1 Tax=Hyphomicrobium sp. TaxID=82 RepID=UPI002C0C4C29|nr:type IV toxin-antitoxin system AbiEi family antitoxin domain-containing protein [Hyphomicrobium sp.]HVZ06245.1 type IV toxin-antitoxin system AbiEi family antitoxin domain-containing protein [Hyphomicrobium sp.]